jgi:hypothetical protein
MEPKVHYRIHNSSPMVPVLSHTNLVHTPYLFHNNNNNNNVILPSMPTSSQFSLHITLFRPNLYIISHYAQS